MPLGTVINRGCFVVLEWRKEDTIWTDQQIGFEAAIEGHIILIVQFNGEVVF